MTRFARKTIVPVVAHSLIERPRLGQELDRAIAASNLVIIAAPAGWGKTTAASSWSQRSGLPVAWYSLDSSDRDPLRFFAYLLHVIEPMVPAVANLANSLDTTSLAGLRELSQQLATLISEAEPFALVLDDFHLLQEDAEASGRPLASTGLLLEWLHLVLDYATVCRVVLTSRTLPLIPGLARLIANRRATVLDYRYLAWDAQDVRHLAMAAYGLMLADNQAQTLVDLHDGWPTGIALALDQVAQQGGGDSLELPPYNAYSYLAEQVLAPLPAELVAFLEDTSVLDDLSAARCDAFRGTNDAASFIDDIQRRGLFVSRRGQSLSFHALFRDFLRARLAHDPLRERGLLLRAGRLYADEDSPEAAVAAYLAAGAIDLAYQLMRECAPLLRQRSQQTTLLACLDRLAQEALLPDDLLLVQAVAYGDLSLWEEAFAALDLAETTGSPAVRHEARVMHIDFLTMQGNYLQAELMLREIDAQQLPDSLQIDYAYTAGRVHLLLGTVDLAIPLLKQAHQLAEARNDQRPDATLMASLYDNLGWAYATKQDVRQAIRHLRLADTYWKATKNAGRRAATLNNLGMLALDAGRHAEARSAFEQALALAVQHGRQREVVAIRCSLAELDTLEGDFGTAQERIDTAYAEAVRHQLSQVLETVLLTAALVEAAVGAGHARDWLGQVRSTDRLTADQRGRLAVIRAVEVLRQPQLDETALRSAVQIARVSQEILSRLDLLLLAFVEAAQLLLEEGWSAATAAGWSLFIDLARLSSEQLLQRIGQLYPPLLAEAGQHQPLPRGLRATHAVAIGADPSAPEWRVVTLGEFSCTSNSTSFALSSLHRTLLARLLDGGTGGVDVNRLFEDVWGGQPFSTSVIHQALYRLRRQTRLDVTIREGICTLPASERIDYDVARFEALVQSGDDAQIDAGLRLYGGDFLPGAFEPALQWVDGRRTYLRERFLQAIERRAQQLETTQPDLAVEYYQRSLQVDMFREQTAVALMQLAARHGNWQLAHTTYLQLASALKSLGLAPTAATAELYNNLKR